MIAGKELKIVKNQLQTTIPKLTIEYVLSMDVKATKWPKTKKNVFLMTTGQDSGINIVFTPSLYTRPPLARFSWEKGKRTAQKMALCCSQLLNFVIFLSKVVKK